MEKAIQLIAALFGSLGFAMLFNIRGRKLYFAAIGGFLAWSAYLLTEFFSANPYICGFTASAVLTFYAECMARVYKTPVTLFLVSAAIPLIPGAALYRTMNCLMHYDFQGFSQESIYTLLFAASMSAGITLTTVFFRMAWRFRHGQRRI